MGRRRELTRGELCSSCKSQLKGDVIGGRKEANGAGFCLEWWMNQMGRVMTRDGQSRMVSIRAWSSCISTRQEAGSLKILAPKGWNVDVVVGFPCKTVNLEQLASRGPTQSQVRITVIVAVQLRRRVRSGFNNRLIASCKAHRYIALVCDRRHRSRTLVDGDSRLEGSEFWKDSTVSHQAKRSKHTWTKWYLDSFVDDLSWTPNRDFSRSIKTDQVENRPRDLINGSWF